MTSPGASLGPRAAAGVAAALAVALILATGLCWAAETGSASEGPTRAAEPLSLSRPAASPEGRDAEGGLEHRLTQRETVRLVLLPVTVTDRRGRIRRDLGAEDFRLLEDRVPQRIRFVAQESNRPLSVVFLLDVSGSMRQLNKLDEAKQAIRIFVEALRPQDRFGLICFADQQVAWITEPTLDRERFFRRLSVQEGYGQTALYDALAATPLLVDQDLDGRKALVLVTDGADNASRLDRSAAIAMARSVNLPIYAIAFSSLPASLFSAENSPEAWRVLSRFAGETGGRLFVVRDPDELKETVLQIQEELRFQYVLGYRSSRRTWRGEFRTIRLETKRRGWTAHTRSGYYATP